MPPLFKVTKIIYKLLASSNTSLTRASLFVAAALVWDSLPQHVMSATSLSVFRSRLKTHLFRCCFPWLRLT